MKLIEVDDGTYDALNVVRHITGRDFPEIIRELVRCDSKNGHKLQGVDGKRADHGMRPSATQATASPKDTELISYVGSPAYLANRSVVDQFLAVLSFAYRQQPTTFMGLERLEGRKRKYFAQGAETLESSGTSVNPKKIPGSPLWVVTNNSTENKKMLLRQALVSLGYGSEATRRAADSLR